MESPDSISLLVQQGKQNKAGRQPQALFHYSPAVEEWYIPYNRSAGSGVPIISEDK